LPPAKNRGFTSCGMPGKEQEASAPVVAPAPEPEPEPEPELEEEEDDDDDDGDMGFGFTLPTVSSAPDVAVNLPKVNSAPSIRVNVAPRVASVADLPPSPAEGPSMGPQMPDQGYNVAYPEVGGYPEAYPEVSPHQEMSSWAGSSYAQQQQQQTGRRKKGTRNGGFDEAEMANMPMLEITQDQIKASIAQIDPDFLEEQRAIAEGKAQATISAKIFNRNTGTSEMSNVLSKTAKRKHQIHTLALAAKEREFMMQHKKGKFTQTKAQTQAKYGW